MVTLNKDHIHLALELIAIAVLGAALYQVLTHS